MLYESFVDNIEANNLISTENPILACVSGGADSMTMLHLLMRYYGDNMDKIMVAHLNHNLRGDDSYRDENFVRKFCEKNNLNFFSESLDIKTLASEQGISIEDCGRKYRYKFFRSISSKHENCKIALAHNLDDQAETVLMRIIRGTGVDGLIGIKESDGDLVRPLLKISREDIEKYIAENDIDFVQDMTNFENDYTRNKLRNELIPSIESIYNPSFKKALLKLSNLASNDVQLKNKYTDDLFNKALIKENQYIIYLDGYQLSQMKDYEQSEILRKSIEKINGDVYGFDYTHIEEFKKIINSHTGKEMTIQNIVVSLSYGNLLIFKKQRNDLDVNIFANEDIEVAINGYKVCLHGQQVKFIIRKRKDGDKLYIKGKYKKLKDFLIDKKIDKIFRDYIPIVEVDGEILAVGDMYINNNLSSKYGIKAYVNGGIYV